MKLIKPHPQLDLAVTNADPKDACGKAVLSCPKMSVLILREECLGSNDDGRCSKILPAYEKETRITRVVNHDRLLRRVVDAGIAQSP